VDITLRSREKLPIGLQQLLQPCTAHETLISQENAKTSACTRKQPRIYWFHF